VNEKITTREQVFPFLFTSFTSFSNEGVMWAGAGVHAPRVNVSLNRGTSEQGERELPSHALSVGFVVHLENNTKVNGGVGQ
jgi:hypothetical protein